MEILVIIGIVILLLLGIIGCFIPVIPGPPISYGGLLLFHFFFERMDLYYVILIGIGVVIVTILDYYLQIYGVKKAGGGKYAIRGSALGMLLGMLFGCILGIFGSLFGILIGAFIGAYVGEVIEGSRKGKWLVVDEKGTELTFNSHQKALNAIKAKRKLVESVNEEFEKSATQRALKTNEHKLKQSELKITKKKPLKIAFGALWGFIAGTILKLSASFFIIYEVLASY